MVAKSEYHTAHGRPQGVSLFLLFLLIALTFAPLCPRAAAQSSNVKMIDVFFVYGNPDYLDLKGRDRFLVSHSSTDNLESWAVGYKAWNLMGEFVYNPSFYYAIDSQQLRGNSRTVIYNEISKYPDLARRYKATRPLSVNFIIVADLVTTDGRQTWVKFKVTNNDLVYFESRSPKNHMSPTSPARWKFAFSTDMMSTDAFTEYDRSDEGRLKELLRDYQRLSFRDGRTYIKLDVKWDGEAIDEIADLYDKYEEEGKKIDKELKALEGGGEKVKATAAYGKDDEMALPVEEEAKTADVINEGGKVGLRAKGKVVFESDQYHGAKPLGGDKSLFAFDTKGGGGVHLYNARGKRLSVGGHTNFLAVIAGDRPGTYRLIVEDGRSAVYTSKRWYYQSTPYFDQRQFDRFRDRDGEPYRPEPPSGDPGGLTIDYPRYMITFYRGTAYTVDGKLNTLSKEPVYYPGEFREPVIGERMIPGRW